MQKKKTANDLMQHLQFDKRDLVANRDGQLGDNQRARLESLQKNALLIGIGGFFGFALLATIFLFFGTESGYLIMTLIGMFLTICNAIFVGMFARQYMRLQADLRSGEIETISGELERVVKADNRQMNNFLVRVDGEDFYIKQEVFLQFQHEAQYDLYRARHSRVLLGAEPSSP